MANASFSFWQMGEELRSLTDSSEDQSWSMAASQLAFVEQVRSKGGDRNTFKPLSSNNEVAKPNVGKGTRPNKYRAEELKGPLKAPLIKHKPLPEGWRLGETGQKSGLLNGILSSNGSLHSSTNVALDKRFKSLPPSESLPRHETLGGYIFVCNNDTMQEDLRRNLFGLPQRYRDSVRAIQPGLPLFLYNYTTHQLHGVFEATSFGGTNIDPTAWEDKKCKGESRFPAQVRIRVRQVFKPLEEDSFRPILHHYDGPKFRLQLSIPETLALLDLFVENELSGKAYGQCAPLATFNIYNFENHHKGLSPYVLASGIKA